MELHPTTDSQIRDMVARLASQGLDDEEIIQRVLAGFYGDDALENDLIEQAATSHLEITVFTPVMLEKAA